MRWTFLFVAMAALAIPGFGQGAEPNAAHKAVPDFSGNWAHPSIPGYEPLASGPTSLVNLARRDSNNVSDNRRLVGDYKNPILKPEAAEVVRKHGELSKAGIGYPTSRNQCWPGGVPFAFTAVTMVMAQSKNDIAIVYSHDDEVRHIRLNAQHPKNLKPSWYGDSVGHFEGDTLVVDTVGIKVGPYAMIDWFGTPRTEGLHLVERYRLIDYAEAKDGLDRDAHENLRVQLDAPDPDYGGKFMQVRFTVEDAAVFTTPWSATMTYAPSKVDWIEEVCAENPFKYGTEKDVDVPTAKTPDF